MERSAFETMLEKAILEVAESILQPGSRKGKTLSAATRRLLSQHPVSDKQSQSASILFAAASVSNGQRMTLKSSADLPPCF